ncbi:hypothetical protein MST27_19930 [Pseudomonas sp. PS1]|uniref:Uncharacterized protein n=1 Tax=Stutzerimonas marianensis TaxID=2929513 RepID=A0A9X1W6E4_9GAMM|nr:hypothetical protein [Pseudomonas marianensis]MCJ0975642.1 hypothetical protein [Pseudomonas marianensis]
MEQAVIVKFSYGLDSIKEIFDLEDLLESAIESAGVGGFDGDEIAVDLSDGYLYMYGPDANAVYAVVEPILKSASFMKSAQVTLVYGELGGDVPRKIVHLS